MPPLSPFNLHGIVVVGGIAALFLFLGESVGMRGLGCVIFASALIGWKSGRIPYGWQGHEPSGYITGVPAKALFVLCGLVGSWMVWDPELWLAILDWADP